MRREKEKNFQSIFSSILNLLVVFHLNGCDMCLVIFLPTYSFFHFLRKLFSSRDLMANSCCSSLTYILHRRLPVEPQFLYIFISFTRSTTDSFNIYLSINWASFQFNRINIDKISKAISFQSSGKNCEYERIRFLPYSFF